MIGGARFCTGAAADYSHRENKKTVTVRAHLASEGPEPDVVAQSQPQRRKMHALVLLLLVCAGLGLLVYPLAGTYLRNVHQESVAEAYRSEEHTSELQSRGHLVCRLLLEKTKTDASHTS